MSGMLARGLGLVIGFWWVATGLIIAMQRSAPTRITALWVATALAVLGIYEMQANANDGSAVGARRSFLGGAMLWGWVSVTFYGGYITGFVRDGLGVAAPAWSLVWPAIESTFVSDVMALLLMGVAWLLLRGDRNRVGLHALAIFWAVQQVAKLNVFLGVRNPAGNFLPAHLAHLRQFFGPLENSWFLAASVAALAGLTVLCGVRATRAAHDGDRQAGILYATILGLAVLELIVLGIPFETTPWDSFLRARGS